MGHKRVSDQRLEELRLSYAAPPSPPEADPDLEVEAGTMHPEAPRTAVAPQGDVPEDVYLSAVKGRSDFRQALKETRPVVAAARALRDKWRTPGQRVDSDDFFAAIHAVCEAADAYDNLKRANNRAAPQSSPVDPRGLKAAIKAIDAFASYDTPTTLAEDCINAYLRVSRPAPDGWRTDPESQP